MLKELRSNGDDGTDREEIPGNESTVDMDAISDMMRGESAVTGEEEKTPPSTTTIKNGKQKVQKKKGLKQKKERWTWTDEMIETLLHT